MTAQRLDRILTGYRIGDPEGLYPIFDPRGSTIAPGRWNDSTTPGIYCSEHYSTAMLEKLVHGNGRLPPNQHFVEITIPNGASYEVVTADRLPDWASADVTAARAYGVAWLRERRSLLLIVPCVVARIERNLLLNPAHPEFPSVAASLHRPVWWDSRLFG